MLPRAGAVKAVVVVGAADLTQLTIAPLTPMSIQATWGCDMNDGDGGDQGQPFSVLGSVGRIALRLAVVVAIAFAASWLITYGMGLSESMPDASQGTVQVAVIATALLVYAVLIATPFVPGIEIGLALLIVRGASIAPAVYLATVMGLLLAYFIGRLVPEATLERTFRDLRLKRAADMLARYGTMSLPERQSSLLSSLPNWLAAPAVRYRYLTLALLINMPGNAFLGGGGGLMLASGLSRLFEPAKTIPTLFLAVLPLPIGFWFFGAVILGAPSP